MNTRRKPVYSIFIFIGFLLFLSSCSGEKKLDEGTTPEEEKEVVSIRIESTTEDTSPSSSQSGTATEKVVETVPLTFQIIEIYNDGSETRLSDEETRKTLVWTYETSDGVKVDASTDHPDQFQYKGTGMVTMKAKISVYSPYQQKTVSLAAERQIKVVEKSLVSIAITSVRPDSDYLGCAGVPAINNKVVEGCLLQFKATGTYDDGTTADLTAHDRITWASLTLNYALMVKDTTDDTFSIYPGTKAYIAGNRDKKGLVFGKRNGDFQLSASMDGIKGITREKEFSVIPETLKRIQITEKDKITNTSSCALAGGTTYFENCSYQFAATGTYNNGAEIDITDKVTWGANKGKIAVFYSNKKDGQVTFLEKDYYSSSETLPVIISASKAGITGSLEIDTIGEEKINTLSITPAATQTLAVSQSYDYDLNATYDSGNSYAIPRKKTSYGYDYKDSENLVWEVPNAVDQPYIRINSDGTVTAEKARSTALTIQASFDGKASSTTLNVSDDASKTVDLKVSSKISEVFEGGSARLVLYAVQDSYQLKELDESEETAVSFLTSGPATCRKVKSGGSLYVDCDFSSVSADTYATVTVNYNLSGEVVSDSHKVRVKNETLESISITASKDDLLPGEELTLTATGTFRGSFSGDSYQNRILNTSNCNLNWSVDGTLTSAPSGNPAITQMASSDVKITATCDKYSGITGTKTLTVTSYPSVTSSSMSASAVAEGSTASVQLNISGAYTRDLVIPYTIVSTQATKGVDYQAGSGSITVPAGSPSAKIDIPTLSDNLDEESESVTVKVGTDFSKAKKPEGNLFATFDTFREASFSITDGTPLPTVQFSGASQTKQEQAGTNTVYLTVRLNRLSDKDVTVTLARKEGTLSDDEHTFDTLSSKVITIPAGEQSGKLSFVISDDNFYENKEKIVFKIASATNATASGQTEHDVWIIDNDPLNLQWNPDSLSTAGEMVNLSTYTYDIVQKTHLGSGTQSSDLNYYIYGNTPSWAKLVNNNTQVQFTPKVSDIGSYDDILVCVQDTNDTSALNGNSCITPFNIRITSCQVTGSGNILGDIFNDNTHCKQGGNHITISSGKTVNFNTDSDNFTGTIVIESGAILSLSGTGKKTANIELNGGTLSVASGTPEIDGEIKITANNSTLNIAESATLLYSHPSTDLTVGAYTLNLSGKGRLAGDRLPELNHAASTLVMTDSGTAANIKLTAGKIIARDDYTVDTIDLSDASSEVTLQQASANKTATFSTLKTSSTAINLKIEGPDTGNGTVVISNSNNKSTLDYHGTISTNIRTTLRLKKLALENGTIIAKSGAQLDLGGSVTTGHLTLNGGNTIAIHQNFELSGAALNDISENAIWNIAGSALKWQVNSTTPAFTGTLNVTGNGEIQVSPNTADPAGSAVIKANINLNAAKLSANMSTSITGDITPGGDAELSGSGAMTYSGAAINIDANTLTYSGSGAFHNSNPVNLDHPDSILVLSGSDGLVKNVSATSSSLNQGKIKALSNATLTTLTLGHSTRIDIADSYTLTVSNRTLIPDTKTLYFSNTGTFAGDLEFDTGSTSTIDINVAGSETTPQTMILSGTLSVNNAHAVIKIANLSILDYTGSSPISLVSGRTLGFSDVGRFQGGISLNGGTLQIAENMTMAGELTVLADSSLMVSANKTFDYIGTTVDIFHSSADLKLNLTGTGTIARTSGSGNAFNIRSHGILASTAKGKISAGIDLNSGTLDIQSNTTLTGKLALVQNSTLHIESGQTLNYNTPSSTRLEGKVLTVTGSGTLSSSHPISLNSTSTDSVLKLTGGGPVSGPIELAGGQLSVESNTTHSGQLTQTASSGIHVTSGHTLQQTYTTDVFSTGSHTLTLSGAGSVLNTNSIRLGTGDTLDITGNGFNLKGPINLNGGTLKTSSTALNSTVSGPITHTGASTLDISHNTSLTVTQPIQVGAHSMTLTGKGSIINNNAIEITTDTGALVFDDTVTVNKVKIEKAGLGNAPMRVNANAVITELTQTQPTRIFFGDNTVLNVQNDNFTIDAPLTLAGPSTGGATGTLKVKGNLIFNTDITASSNTIIDVTNTGKKIILNSDVSLDGTIKTSASNTTLQLGTASNSYIFQNKTSVSIKTLNLNERHLTLGSAATDLLVTDAIVIDNPNEGLSTKDADLNALINMSAGALNSTSGTLNIRGTISGGTINMATSTVNLQQDLILAPTALTSNGTTWNTGIHNLTWGGTASLAGFAGTINVQSQSSPAVEGKLTITTNSGIAADINLKGGMLSVEKNASVSGTIKNEANSTIRLLKDLTISSSNVLAVGTGRLTLSGTGKLLNTTAIDLDRTTSVLDLNGISEISNISVSTDNTAIQLQADAKIGTLALNAPADLKLANGKNLDIHSLDVTHDLTVRELVNGAGSGTLTYSGSVFNISAAMVCNNATTMTFSAADTTMSLSAGGSFTGNACVKNFQNIKTLSVPDGTFTAGNGPLKLGKRGVDSTISGASFDIRNTPVTLEGNLHLNSTGMRSDTATSWSVADHKLKWTNGGNSFNASTLTVGVGGEFEIDGTPNAATHTTINLSGTFNPRVNTTHTGDITLTGHTVIEIPNTVTLTTANALSIGPNSLELNSSGTLNNSTAVTLDHSASRLLLSGGGTVSKVDVAATPGSDKGVRISSDTTIGQFALSENGTLTYTADKTLTLTEHTTLSRQLTLSGRGTLRFSGNLILQSDIEDHDSAVIEVLNGDLILGSDLSLLGTLNLSPLNTTIQLDGTTHVNLSTANPVSVKTVKFGGKQLTLGGRATDLAIAKGNNDTGAIFRIGENAGEGLITGVNDLSIAPSVLIDNGAILGSTGGTLALKGSLSGAVFNGSGTTVNPSGHLTLTDVTGNFITGSNTWNIGTHHISWNGTGTTWGGSIDMGSGSQFSFSGDAPGLSGDLTLSGDSTLHIPGTLTYTGAAIPLESHRLTLGGGGTFDNDTGKEITLNNGSGKLKLAGSGGVVDYVKVTAELAGEGKIEVTEDATIHQLILSGTSAKKAHVNIAFENNETLILDSNLVIDNNNGLTTTGHSGTLRINKTLTLTTPSGWNMANPVTVDLAQDSSRLVLNGTVNFSNPVTTDAGKTGLSLSGNTTFTTTGPLNIKTLDFGGNHLTLDDGSANVMNLTVSDPLAINSGEGLTVDGSNVTLSGAFSVQSGGSVSVTNGSVNLNSSAETVVNGVMTVSGSTVKAKGNMVLNAAAGITTNAGTTWDMDTNKTLTWKVNGSGSFNGKVRFSGTSGGFDIQNNTTLNLATQIESSGGTFKIGKDVILSKEIILASGQNLTLNLSGGDLTYNGSGLNVGSGTVTLLGSGNLKGSGAIQLNKANGTLATNNPSGHITALNTGSFSSGSDYATVRTEDYHNILTTTLSEMIHAKVRSDRILNINKLISTSGGRAKVYLENVVNYTGKLILHEIRMSGNLTFGGHASVTMAADASLIVSESSTLTVESGQSLTFSDGLVISNNKKLTIHTNSGAEVLIQNGAIIGTGASIELTGAGAVQFINCNLPDGTVTDNRSNADGENNTVLNFKALSHSENEIKLSWAYQGGYDQVRLYRSTTENFTPSDASNKVYEGSLTTWTDSSLTTGTVYYYKAIAYKNTLKAKAVETYASPAYVSNSLKAYYPMNKSLSASDELEDASGQTNTGRLYGSVNVTATPDYNNKSGNLHNGAVSLDGMDDFFEIRNPFLSGTQSDNESSSSDMSFSLWLKSSQTGDSIKSNWSEGRGLISGHNGSNDIGISYNNGTILFGVDSSTPDGSKTISSTKALGDNRWHHVVATRKSGTGALNLYINGQLNVTGISDSGSLGLPELMRIGALKYQSGIFSGAVDDIQIYNKLLSENDIQQLHSKPLGLIGYIDLNSESTPKVADLSGNSVAVSSVNITSTTDKDGRVKQALGFNGSSHADITMDITRTKMPNLTVTAWVKVSSSSGTHVIYSNASSSNRAGRGLTIQNGRFYLLYNVWGAVWNQTYDTGVTASDTVWVHVAVTYDGNSKKVIFYKNGTATPMGTLEDENAGDDTKFSIGAHVDHSQPFNGIMDEFRIYNRVLSATEISHLAAGLL